MNHTSLEALCDSLFRGKDMYALVTGASSGIGKAVAIEFARRGLNLILTYCESENGIRETEKEIAKVKSDAMVYSFKVDFKKIAAVHAFTEELIAKKLCPEIIVNNAGVCKPSLIQDISDEDWDEVMNVNLKSVFAICHDLVPKMIERKSGSIVNISSIWGRTGASMESSYSASKGAIVTFTKSLAAELGPSGIRVNCVSPGCVDTRMNAGYSKDERKALEDITPLGRFATPEEIAKTVAFLALDASFVTGEDLLVDGGFLI